MRIPATPLYFSAYKKNDSLSSRKKRRAEAKTQQIKEIPIRTRLENAIESCDSHRSSQYIRDARMAIFAALRATLSKGKAQSISIDTTDAKGTKITFTGQYDGTDNLNDVSATYTTKTEFAPPPQPSRPLRKIKLLTSALKDTHPSKPVDIDYVKKLTVEYSCHADSSYFYPHELSDTHQVVITYDVVLSGHEPYRVQQTITGDANIIFKTDSTRILKDS